MSKDNGPQHKSEFPQEGSRGSGAETAYSVEARSMYGEPKKIGDFIFHKEWRKVRFDKAKVGVPNDVGQACSNIDLLSYKAAQALRWWFLAGLGYESTSFETRIIKHVVTHSYSEEVVGAFDVIGGEDCSSIMPDFKGNK